MKTRRLFVLWIVVGIVAQATQAATNRPVPVSPGNASGLARVAGRCPTFSWGSAPGAKLYELVVYAVPVARAARPSEAVRVLQVKLPGSASSWTPSIERCLERNKSYAWSVRAIGRKAPRDWSELALFQVASGPTTDDFQDALAVVQKYLTIHGEATALGGGSAGVGGALEASTAGRNKERVSTLQGTAGPSFSVDGTGNVQGASFTGDGSGLTNVTAADLICAGCVAESELAFDPASQGELDGHKTSSDHDSSYVAKDGDTMTGILNLPSDSLVVGTSQLVISGGNVGIATASPSHPLHLSKFLNGAHLVAMIENTGPFSAAALRLKTPAAGNDWSWAAQETGGGAARGLEVQNPSFATPPLAIAASTGFVGIGVLSPADKLQVAGDIRVGTGTTGCVKDADGTVIAGTCSSDVRLKKDIVPLADMLPKVSRLTPVHFNWRSEEFPELALGQETQLGLIAQEVERVLPELVSVGDDGLKRVHYSEIPILLLQAVKEQQQENERLRQRISELSERLQAIER